MKNWLFFLALLGSSQLCAQKNKTRSVEDPVLVSGSLTVTRQSKVTGKSFYEAFSFLPKSKGSLRLTGTSDQPYQLQVKSKAKLYTDQKLTRGFNFVWPLESLDSVFVYFVANPKDSAKFQYSYVIFDTAQIILSKKPEAAFIQLIKMAGAGFINLLPSSNADAYNADLEFANGVFGPLRATKDRRTFKQYTAMAVDEATADNAIKEWDKKVKAWLKPFKVNDVKTLSGQELVQRSNYLLHQQATVYTKMNAQGQRLFTVYVYKSTDDGSNFYSGVAITN